jgi:hypothetical protein
VLIRVSGSQFPADGHSVLLGRERVGWAAQVREPDSRASQRVSQAGAVLVRVGCGQVPVDGDGFFGHRERVSRAPQLRERDAEVVQRAGEAGTVPVPVAAVSSR